MMGQERRLLHEQTQLPACAKFNSVPQIHVHLEPVNVTLFRNRVFADIIKSR